MKINNLEELKAAKRLLQREQQELENAMKGNWGEVKDSLKPANIAKNAIGGIFKKIRAGASSLVKKITGKSKKRDDNNQQLLN